MPIEDPQGFQVKQDLIIPASKTPERNMLLTALGNKELASRLYRITHTNFTQGSEEYHTIVEAAERLKSL